jgi:hypothetical protein
VPDEDQAEGEGLIVGRRRGNSKPIISAILQQIEAWKTIADMPSGDTGAKLDYEFEWIYISPSGKRREVTKSELDGTTDGWPLPGTYEVTAIDSNGDPLPGMDPWIAEHVDKDTLAETKAQATDNPLMNAVHGLLEEARVTIRDQRRQIDDITKRQNDAEDKMRTAQRQLAEAQQKMAESELVAQRALADKNFAEAKQKEAEDAYTELDRSINAFEPQIKAGVDRVMERFLGPFVPTAPAENDDDPPSQKRVVAPAPGGDDTPERAKAVVDDLLETMMDIDVCRPLVESGRLEWATVRYVVWKYTGEDVGPEIDWSAWEAHEEASNAG